VFPAIQERAGEAALGATPFFVAGDLNVRGYDDARQAGQWVLTVDITRGFPST